MIPEFPKFKKLELSDKKDIENFTHKFPPYSDFNFANMWAWDIHQKTRISQLNGNFVVLFSDYVHGGQFLMFIGKNKISQTTKQLIEFSEKHHNTNVLKFIPEEMAYILEKEGYVVKPDRDSYDYVYSVAHLAKMDSWPSSGISKRIRQFIKLYPDYVIKKSSIHEIAKDEYEKIFKKWAKNKKVDDHFELSEYKAFKRFIQINCKNTEVVSMYIHDTLVGFTMYVTLPNHCSISHFIKSDTELHCGINDVLNWEEAKHLLIKGVKYNNWEQDLGIPGLRSSKEKYTPTHFMKKFIIGNK